MNNKEFIEAIAKYVQKYADKYNIKVCSPIIAQACLESGYGTSAKAQHHNYFGLKYRQNRVTCNSGYFRDGGSEQNPDGSYRPIDDDWYAFENMEKGVEGYFQFINIPHYASLKCITDPELYLKAIKAAGYATSKDYVENNMRVIKTWNLTQYDKPRLSEKHKGTIFGGNAEAKKQEVPVNSPLVDFTLISPNKNSPRNHVIDTITIHHMAGNLSVESCANCFQGIRQASANYGIGTDGRIGLYVDETDRAWTSGNRENDNRAVTIEVANDGGAPDWHVSDKAIESLIKLCADICKRNNIKRLNWVNDKSLIGQTDKLNLTVHRWFQPTACPGEYLFSKLDYVASEVNKLLGAGIAVKPVIKPAEESKSAPAAPFLVKVKVPSLNIRKGPGQDYELEGTITSQGVFTIVEVDEKTNYGKLKSGRGWICLGYCERK